MLSDDGQIDCSQYSKSELIEARQSIDAERYPVNYRKLNEALMATEGSVREEPKPVLRKPLSEIHVEFEATLRKTKIASFLFILFWLPYLITGFWNLDNLLGLSRLVWLSVAGLALTGYTVFCVLVWRCPNCGKFPGGGWSRSECRVCEAALRENAT